MIILFGAAIGVAILSLAWGITAKPSTARANLFADLPAPPVPESRLIGIMRGLGQSVLRFIPKPLIEGLRNNLVLAGHPRGMDMGRLVGVKVVLAALLGGVFFLAGQPIWGLGFALVGFFAPDYWLLSEKDKRQALMRDAAADTIDQLTIVVEAGLGFDAALLRVASTNEGPLALELQHTVDDMRAGVPRDMALQGLADRTRISEIRHLVTALAQAQRHGTPLADTLRVQAAELRDKRTQRVEEKAAKIQTKMIFPIVFCFMPVFFIIILVPALSALVDAFAK
jgi:tight adherence protein C